MFTSLQISLPTPTQRKTGQFCRRKAARLTFRSGMWIARVREKQVVRLLICKSPITQLHLMVRSMKHQLYKIYIAFRNIGNIGSE